MKLLLDIGNTRIKWVSAEGLLDDVQLSQQQALPIADLSDEQLCEHVLAADARPDKVCVSNVAGSGMAQRIQRLVQQKWQRDAEFFTATAQARVGDKTVRNAYREPGKLGVDRWLALLGAAHSPYAALVVSVGTAMTLDALDADGQHLGGLIVPGPDLMMTSLLSNTSDIAGRANSDAVRSSSSAGYFSDDTYFSDNTQGCVMQGAHHACGALIAEAYAHLASDDVQVWLTGGAAPNLLHELTMPVRHVPDLVLRGMATQL